MLTVSKCLPAGRGLAPVLLKRAPTVQLDWDVRQKSRFEAQDSAGRRLGVFLPRGTVVRGGDVLVAEDGSMVRVAAAPQPVLEVRACPQHGSPFDLMRAAYHLGNRHVQLELRPDCLRLEPDHVLADLLRAMHLQVAEVQAPFEPEAGAYAAGTQGHGHGHGHERAQAHGHTHAAAPQGHAHTGQHATGQHATGQPQACGHGPAHGASGAQHHEHGPACGHGPSHAQTEAHAAAPQHGHAAHGHAHGASCGHAQPAPHAQGSSCSHDHGAVSNPDHGHSHHESCGHAGHHQAHGPAQGPAQARAAAPAGAKPAP